MFSLPPDLDSSCFSLFLQCEEFDSARSLRALFVTTDLAPFANSLPERSGSKRSFVTEVKLFLLEKRLADGRILLLPFLNTLRGRYSKQEALHGELNELYQGVLALSGGPSTGQTTASIGSTSSPQGHELDRAEFREKLVRYFSSSELRTLCFDMNIQYDDFRPGRSQMAEDLVEYCERNGRTPELLNHCRKLRPHVNW